METTQTAPESTLAPAGPETKSAPLWTGPKKRRKWLKRLIVIAAVLALLFWMVIRPMLSGPAVMSGAYQPVQAQRQDPHSIWRHVQRTLALRKDPAWRDLFVYGSFQLVEAEHPQLFAYCRRDEHREVWVISNFTAQPASIRLPQCSLRCLLANYPDSDPHPGDNLLRPYESLAVLIGAKEKQQ